MGLNELEGQLDARVIALQSLVGSSARLRSASSVAFLGLPQLAQVRVASSQEPFPRISDLVEDMERERDDAEGQVKKTDLGIGAALIAGRKRYDQRRSQCSGQRNYGLTLLLSRRVSSVTEDPRILTISRMWPKSASERI